MERNLQAPQVAISPCYEMSNFEGEVGRVQGGAICPRTVKIACFFEKNCMCNFDHPFLPHLKSKC
jgi:hypothetical protein